MESLSTSESKSLKLSSIIVEGFEYDLLLEQPFLMQTVLTGTIGVSGVF